MEVHESASRNNIMHTAAQFVQNINSCDVLEYILMNCPIDLEEQNANKLTPIDICKKIPNPIRIKIAVDCEARRNEAKRKREKIAELHKQ